MRCGSRRINRAVVGAGAAIVEGAEARFRPIALTSLTTFLGFAPHSRTGHSGQFLVPFAASLGVGIMRQRY